MGWIVRPASPIDSIPPANHDPAGCVLLREKAAEYRRLSQLATNPSIAQQLCEFAEAYLALANKLSGSAAASDSRAGSS